MTDDSDVLDHVGNCYDNYNSDFFVKLVIGVLGNGCSSGV